MSLSRSPSRRFCTSIPTLVPVQTVIRSASSVAALAIMLAGVGVSPLLAQSPTLDRTKQPPAPPAKALVFPTAQTRTLANGVRVVVLEDHTSPVVSVVTIADVSSALDPAGKTGLGAITSAMLDEGTTTRTADQLAEAFAELGNSVSPFGFYTITANVDRSMALMADQLLHPAFPTASLERIKANTVADIQRSREDAQYLARRVFATQIYGASHPYARTATERETASITHDDVASFYNTYFRPPNITFVVAGDITPAQAAEKLDRAFGTWTSGTSGQLAVTPPHGADSTVVYLYDRPGSPQSVILFGGVGPRRDSPDYFAIRLMNVAFGGAFNSRLNLNLREQHQYAYGANAGFNFRRVPEVGTFAGGSAVATPKTDSATIEIMKELRDIRGARPITADERVFAERLLTTGLPLQFETISERASAVASLVRNNIPLDYYNTVVAKYDAVTLDQIRAAAKQYLDPSKMAIVIVGDRRTIEPTLRAAKIAPVVVVEKIS